MNATLGIDIGTYESKGVLVDADGRVLASAARPHELIVPRAGWAEHRADEDWWADFVWLSRKLLADSGLDASEVKAVGASAIGPCMLPVDAERRAAHERRALWRGHARVPRDRGSDRKHWRRPHPLASAATR